MNASARTLQIFIVEDHPGTLTYLRMYLEQLGHTVRSATTFKAAISVLGNTPCDLLLSDVSLPDGNGWELLQRLGTARPTFSVAMSGFGLKADQTRSRAAGFRHHLIKPFHPEELDAIIAEVCREILAAQAGA